MSRTKQYTPGQKVKVPMGLESHVIGYVISGPHRPSQQMNETYRAQYGKAHGSYHKIKSGNQVLNIINKYIRPID